ncbi:MAG: NUDIX hydrolase [Microthrixaceae bacterium]
MHDWLVAGAIIESDDGLLLVRNQRRNGLSDWTPPGGVIEAGERGDVREGLAREVAEETGLSVDEFGPLLYEVEAVAPDLGWRMSAQIYARSAPSRAACTPVTTPTASSPPRRTFPSPNARPGWTAHTTGFANR